MSKGKNTEPKLSEDELAVRIEIAKGAKQEGTETRPSRTGHFEEIDAAMTRLEEDPVVMDLLKKANKP